MTAIWPVLTYEDARAAIDWLEAAFGFHRTLVVPPEDGPVLHSELRLPSGAGVMVGSAGVGSEEVFASWPAHAASVYLVVDDPEPLFASATANGAEVVRPLRHEDFGSYGFAVRDLEGNVWSVGTYAGA